MERVVVQGVEHPNLPEHFTKENLRSWRVALNIEQPSPPGFIVRSPIADYTVSAQHRSGLAADIKRCIKSSRENKPISYIPKSNKRLPPHLRDVERFNPEFLHPTTTIWKSRLPTVAVIEEEKQMDELAKEKSWAHGLILTDQSCLIDPMWERSKDNAVPSASSNADQRTFQVAQTIALQTFAK